MKGESVLFKEGDEVKIHFDPVIGDSNNISFSPDSVSRQFQIGDRIKADFNAVCFRIEKVEDLDLVAVVERSVHVGSNKAADIVREVKLDAITVKDHDAFIIDLDMGVRNFSLSFANSAKDIKSIRNIIGYKTNLISKFPKLKVSAGY